MKDTLGIVHQPNAFSLPLGRTIAEGYANDFACNLYLRSLASSIVWHDYADLKVFKVAAYRGQRIRSTFANLGAWWASRPHLLSYIRANDHVPVCYGGVFMGQSKLRVPNEFGALMNDMRMGEVNHFMERTWAALFTTRNERCYCRSLKRSNETYWFMPGPRACDQWSNTRRDVRWGTSRASSRAKKEVCYHLASINNYELTPPRGVGALLYVPLAKLSALAKNP